jgi:hypothetical protein
MIDVSQGFEQIDEVDQNVFDIKKIKKPNSFKFYPSKLQMGWEDS